MNWINRHKLPATEAIKFNGQPCITPDSLWGALHNTFNHAIDCQVNVDVLNKIKSKTTSLWEPFSIHEFRSTINKCNNSSVPGLDKITWHHLKFALKQEECLSNIINIANTCINLGHWLNYFKCSSTVIIPKLNKLAYDHPKAFHPIVLLNTLEKLIEKVIAERIQFIIAENSFIHLSQLDSLKTKTTSNTGIALTYIVHSCWTKNKSTSVLAFDIVQFFLSLNHRLLTIILGETGLELKVALFFADYLVKKNQLHLEQIIFPELRSECGSRPRVCPLSYLVSSLSFTIFIYSRKTS